MALLPAILASLRMRHSCPGLMVRTLPWLLMLAATSCGTASSTEMPQGFPAPAAGGNPSSTSPADNLKSPPGPGPNAPIEPVIGELTILQLDLPPGPTLRTGETTLVVGPDGTLVLVDLGNARHSQNILATVEHLNTEVLIPARGYPARKARQVEWVVLTHFHGDHIGGANDLFGERRPLEGLRGVVHRGWVDVGNGLNGEDYQLLCVELRESHPSWDVPLCRSQTLAPCEGANAVDTHPATGCPGLRWGDLSTSEDDEAQHPTYIPLGHGARFTLIAADGWVLNDKAAIPMSPPFGTADSNEENARSLVGILSYGAFRYHHAGDLTGSGDPGEPDLESHLARTAGQTFYGETGMDVIHVNHHARRTSSNATFVDLVAPNDGGSRNAIIGLNAGYLNSPHSSVLDIWLGANRLGEGWMWSGALPPAGATHPRLRAAGGTLIVQTVHKGQRYQIQATGNPETAREYPSLGRAPSEDPPLPGGH